MRLRSGFASAPQIRPRNPLRHTCLRMQHHQHRSLRQHRRACAGCRSVLIRPGAPVCRSSLLRPVVPAGQVVLPRASPRPSPPLRAHRPRCGEQTSPNPSRAACVCVAACPVLRLLFFCQRQGFPRAAARGCGSPGGTFPAGESTVRANPSGYIPFRLDLVLLPAGE